MCGPDSCTGTLQSMSHAEVHVWTGFRTQEHSNSCHRLISHAQLHAMHASLRAFRARHSPVTAYEINDPASAHVRTCGPIESRGVEEHVVSPDIPDRASALRRWCVESCGWASNIEWICSGRRRERCRAQVWWERLRWGLLYAP